MPIPGFPTPEAQRLTDALLAARQRVQQGTQPPIPGLGPVVRLFGPIGEVLGWIVAVDDILEDADGTYRARRDGHADGRLMRGLRYARNQVIRGGQSSSSTMARGGQRLSAWRPISWRSSASRVFGAQMRIAIRELVNAIWAHVDEELRDYPRGARARQASTRFDSPTAPVSGRTHRRQRRQSGTIRRTRTQKIRSCGSSERRRLSRTGHLELLAKQEVLQDEVVATPDGRSSRTDDQRKELRHGRTTAVRSSPLWDRLLPSDTHVVSIAATRLG